jgi:hypothetical protein
VAKTKQRLVERVETQQREVDSMEYKHTTQKFVELIRRQAEAAYEEHEPVKLSPVALLAYIEEFEEMATRIVELETERNTIVEQFYNRVCDRAEMNMESTGTVSGAHWNAMRQEMVALGME